MASGKDKEVAALLEQEGWHAERKMLRSILLDSGLAEAVKWNKLTYTYEDANVAIIYGMADSCAVGFFKGSLLEDKEKSLVAPGKHSQAMRRLHFESLTEIEEQEELIRDTIAEAIQLEKDGAEIQETDSKTPDLPAELIDAFDEDPDFKQAFDDLTPGRQRGYLIHFGDAKQAETRTRRIDKWRDAIMDGRGMHDR